jgi:hypothetical protein
MSIRASRPCQWQDERCYAPPLTMPPAPARGAIKRVKATSAFALSPEREAKVTQQRGSILDLSGFQREQAPTIRINLSTIPDLRKCTDGILIYEYFVKNSKTFIFFLLDFCESFNTPSSCRPQKRCYNSWRALFRLSKTVPAHSVFHTGTRMTHLD